MDNFLAKAKEGASTAFTTTARVAGTAAGATKEAVASGWTASQPALAKGKQGAAAGWQATSATVSQGWQSAQPTLSSVGSKSLNAASGAAAVAKMKLGSLFGGK